MWPFKKKKITNNMEAILSLLEKYVGIIENPYWYTERDGSFSRSSKDEEAVQVIQSLWELMHKPMIRCAEQQCEHLKSRIVDYVQNQSYSELRGFANRLVEDALCGEIARLKTRIDHLEKEFKNFQKQIEFINVVSGRYLNEVKE